MRSASSSKGFVTKSAAPCFIAWTAAETVLVAVNTITEITPGNVQSTFSAGGSLNRPQGLAFDTAGNLYVANFSGNSITEIPLRVTPAPDASNA